MTSFAKDSYRPATGPADLDYARIRGQLVRATARLVAAIRTLDNGAWEHLTGQQPGYAVTTSGTTARVTGGDIGYTVDTSVLNQGALAELQQLTDQALATARATGLVYDVAMRWAARRARPVIPPDDPTTCCASCIRIGVVSNRYRGDRCRWCYEFEQVEHQLPPPELLRLRRDKGKVTAKDVAEALGKPVPGPAKKKR